MLTQSITYTIVGQIKYNGGLELALRLDLPASNICPEYKGVFKPLLGCRVSSWPHAGRLQPLNALPLNSFWRPGCPLGKGQLEGRPGRAGRAARARKTRWQGPGPMHASLVCRTGWPKLCQEGGPRPALLRVLEKSQENDLSKCGRRSQRPLSPWWGHLPLPQLGAHVLTGRWAGGLISMSAKGQRLSLI